MKIISELLFILAFLLSGLLVVVVDVAYSAWPGECTATIQTNVGSCEDAVGRNLIPWDMIDGVKTETGPFQVYQPYCVGDRIEAHYYEAGSWHLNDAGTGYNDRLLTGYPTSLPEGCGSTCPDPGSYYGYLTTSGKYNPDPSPACVDGCELSEITDGLNFTYVNDDGSWTTFHGDYEYTGNECPSPQEEQPTEKLPPDGCPFICGGDDRVIYEDPSTGACECDTVLPDEPMASNPPGSEFKPDQDKDGLPSGGMDDDNDGDGVKNGSDMDVDGDGISNGSDTDLDGDGDANGSWVNPVTGGNYSGPGNDSDNDDDGIPNDQDGTPNGSGGETGSGTFDDGTTATGDGTGDSDGDGIPNSEDPDYDPTEEEGLPEYSGEEPPERGTFTDLVNLQPLADAGSVIYNKMPLQVFSGVGTLFGSETNTAPVLTISMPDVGFMGETIFGQEYVADLSPFDLMAKVVRWMSACLLIVLFAWKITSMFTGNK